MSYGICLTIIGPALKNVQGEIMLTGSQLGLFTASLSVGLIISVLAGGFFVDRYRVKSVGLVGQLLLTLGFLTFSMFKSFPVGLFAFFIMGFGGGLIEIVVNTIISDIYAERRTAALNLLHGFFGVGALIGPILMGYLIESGFGWRFGYQSIALFSSVVLILQLLTKYPDKVSSDRIEFSYFFKILRNPYTLLLGAIILLYVGSEMGINYWSVLYMETNLAVPKIAASSFLTYFWMAMTFGRFITFLIARKIGSKKLLFFLTLSSVFAFGVFMFAESETAAGVSLLILGLAFSGIFPTVVALGTDRFSETLGTITGFLMMFMGGGTLLFPWLIGAISDVYSLTAGMFSILLFIVMLTILTALLGLKRISQS
jgi:fucose permease